MRNLSRLLQDIKENPVMYIDKPSITHLSSFVSGWYFSQINHFGFNPEGYPMQGFDEWMQERAKTTVSRSWTEIILFLCRTERNAFYRFFEEYEQFLKHKDNSKIQESEEKASPTEDNSKFRQFDIYNDILKGIKKRPGMYLRTSPITELDMLLRGYSLSRKEVSVPPTEPEREFEGFQSWVQEKYGIKSGQSWSKIILFYSVDEHEALYKFFELFEEYLNKNKSLEVDENSG
ncbi:hypothetical protein [uncultured Nostoc sp.]|uniref:hypothetical protein n=1 Tax=uncultured Nostoc sp. TaxID=340711 RepID=UPI0035CC0F00